MSIYAGDFSNQADVENQFQCGSLEDCYIVYAAYEIGDYCGSAFVLFVKDAQLYEVNASHCSCYGLEGQWDFEETTLEALKHRAYKGNLNDLLGGYGAEVLSEVAMLGLS